MKINNGNDILPALPLYIAIADDDINYNILILKTTIIGITNDISPGRNIVIISYYGGSKEINLAEVTNQPTWTNDLPGSLIAITDIDSWVIDNTPITNTQIRATPLPVSLPAGLAIAANQQTDALTDAELRATPIPIIGAVLTGGLTDAELRTSPVDISSTNLDIRDLVFATDKVDVSGSSIDVNSMPQNTLSAGSITAVGQTVSITVPPGGSSIGLQISGVWVGQIEFEATVNGVDYISVYASNNFGNSTNAVSGNGGFILPAAGFTTIRVRSSAWTSGTALIDFNASIGGSGAVITQALPSGNNNIGDVDVLTMPIVAVTGPLTDAELRATPVPISATNLDIRDLVFANDKVDVTGSIVAAVVSATDLDIRNLVFATDKVDVSGSSGVGVTGTFFQATQPISAASLPLPTGAATSALQTQPGVDIGDVTVNNAAGAAAVNIQDGGNSITVDGAFFQATQPVSATDLDIRNLVFATDKVDASGTTLGANSGVDIGDVTINNAAGAAAVNIQDGGNSITVDGTVTANAGTNLNTSALNLEATQADVRTALQIIDDWDETDRAKVNPIVGQAGVQGGSGAVSANTQRVVLATDVALPAGTNNIGDVDILSIVPGTAATNLGKAEDVAHTTGDTGVMVLGVSNEGGTALVNANGDYTPIATDKMGQIYVNPENNKVLFRGRSASFRTLGRAGTAGQKILAIHNATGSSITVKVNKIVVDTWCTVVKAITVAPPIVRIWKFTAVPTNGTTLTKNKIGGTTTSNASAVVFNDSSADGTGSGTTLTVTLPAGTILDQKVVPRVITAAGEISISALEFDYPKGIQLAALEGVCVFLDYTLATQNPVTDMWTVSVEWEESTT